MNVEPRPLGRCQMLHLVQVLNTINPPFFSEGKPSLPGFISSGEDHMDIRPTGDGFLVALSNAA